MTNHRSKEIHQLPAEETKKIFDLAFALPEERAAREREWKCGYPDCRNPADFIVKHFTDGDLDKEYLVCFMHEPEERKV